MGIHGLLPSLQSVMNDIHISELSNKKIAIDIYCWLHKGIYSCSLELSQNIPTYKYIEYCLKRIYLLLEYKIIPIIVFDGAPLPAKSETEEERKRSRENHFQQALIFLNRGDIKSAKKEFSRGIDITPEMAAKLMIELQKNEIKYIVAPYEADAQLAYLALNNYVDAVITEDSDMIVYGCPRILFKLDQFGNAKEIQIKNIQSCKKPNFQYFTFSMFRHVCILSGCDYAEGIPGLGIMKASKLLQNFKTIENVIHFLKKNNKFNIPENYEEIFQKAELTFLHQRVFDYNKNELINLTPIDLKSWPLKYTNNDFLGPEIPNDIATKIAYGFLNPISKLPYDFINTKELETSKEQQNKLKIFQNSKKNVKNFDFLIPIQKNVISNYFVSNEKISCKPFIPPRLKRQSNSNNIFKKENLCKEQQSSPKKIKVNENSIIVPRTPPQNKPTIIVSKYFSSSKKSLFHTLEQNSKNEDENENEKIFSFSSPFFNNNERLSLKKSWSISNPEKIVINNEIKNEIILNDIEIFSDNEEIISDNEEIISDNEEILSNNEEIISDNEEILSNNEKFNNQEINNDKNNKN